MQLKIAIIFNKPSSDRYSSMGESKAIASVMDEVKAVYKALSELGYSAIKVPLRPPLDQVKEKLKDLEAEVIFNLFEGFEGLPETEAEVAHILSELGIPCLWP